MGKIVSSSKIFGLKHFVHEMNPALGGVASSVQCLHEELLKLNQNSEIIDRVDRAKTIGEFEKGCIIVHGLWQWPGEIAFKKWKDSKVPFLVFPHGMLDPWFKKAYLLKHIKKQTYWWWKQGGILSNARAVCFTTEEERLLAQKTFFPYRCKEVVTGLGVSEPPPSSSKDETEFLHHYPFLAGKRVLLYLGRFHPKKGVDLLIEQWIAHGFDPKNCALVLGGPLPKDCTYLNKLRNLANGSPSIHWTGMLEGPWKWAALRLASALILPSHQENYGMVVAEACSVGTPVLLTNKVNLWREIDVSKAGVVAQDNSFGVYELLQKWDRGINSNMKKAALLCFSKHLHARNAAKKILKLSSKVEMNREMKKPI